MVKMSYIIDSSDFQSYGTLRSVLPAPTLWETNLALIPRISHFHQITLRFLFKDLSNSLGKLGPVVIDVDIDRIFVVLMAAGIAKSIYAEFAGGSGGFGSGCA